MRRAAPIEYTTVTSVRGPLVVISGADGIGWDEVVEIRTDDGTRHGTVIDVSNDLAVVQVDEGTAGLAPGRMRVAFRGTTLRIPVGGGWLGRVCNGRGDPIDGGPPVFAAQTADVSGHPINPTARLTPRDPILTGVSVIDGMATLVRGQKLPIFSVGGLPHLEVATQIAAQARCEDGDFAVIFAAVGITNADASAVRTQLEERAAGGDLTLLINTAEDPVVERILTPRIALTVAEHLAFERGRHVLVVIADMTSYCEALREIAAARGETPGRRGYPGYLYSDLASIYERAGRIRGRRGSVTQLPVLTMPAGDITHPVPDLTGYITEGQIVLSADEHVRGVFPPFDPLRSLSRLMRLGAGTGHTRGDHLELAAQLYALSSEARRAADLADLVGEDGLNEVDRAYLRFAAQFRATFVAQSQTEDRTLEQTLERGWHVASVMPRDRLRMLPEAMLDLYYDTRDQDDARPPG